MIWPQNKKKLVATFFLKTSLGTISNSTYSNFYHVIEQSRDQSLMKTHASLQMHAHATLCVCWFKNRKENWECEITKLNSVELKMTVT